MASANQYIGLFAIVVRDYDEAIAFYVDKLGWELREDTPQSPTKRWVVVAPPGSQESAVLLARAAEPRQEEAIGNQTGGRVGFFLYTDDFERDYERYRAAGVEFVRPVIHEPYGTVSVFEDLYGNRWDLVGPPPD